MIEKLLAAIASFIIALISTLGYSGIILTMAIESACIPLPSEVIMPFSGFLVFQHRFVLWGAALAGAIGCVIGSLVAYAIGRFGGREFLLKYGRIFFVSHHDIEIADRWFARFGGGVVFFSRLLPVIRTFISLPAGVARMPLGRFVLYTLLGSFPWCYGLAWGGMKLGEHWTVFGGYFHRFHLVIVALGLVGIIAWVVQHRKITSPASRP